MMKNEDALYLFRISRRAPPKSGTHMLRTGVGLWPSSV
jgi:hypothetical protein